MSHAQPISSVRRRRKMKGFEDWTWQNLNLEFGLKRVKQHATLTNWLDAQPAVNQREEDNIRDLLASVDAVADTYNEDELKFMFIGPLIALVGYRGDAYRAFTQRNLEAFVKNKEGVDVLMKGRVEFMVAYGLQSPLQPYFFFHEYKQETRRDNDPLGQLLASMLTAQHLNDEKQGPLYGCYITGRFWYFVVLHGQEYAVSRAYDATQPDVYAIFRALREAKAYIETNVKDLSI